MASQDARLSKFEADFKQQQSEMTNKIDTVLKAITDQITRALPNDKNPKLSTSPVLSARSYPTIDPQCSSHPSTSINAIKTCSKEATISQMSLAIPINLKSNMWESGGLIKNPINWDKPPKDEDEAWHAKIRLIDPDGEEFTKTLQSIPTVNPHHGS
ncbi:hypothetical protein Tco_0144566 [Tanacetum coccineum]